MDSISSFDFANNFDIALAIAAMGETLVIAPFVVAEGTEDWHKDSVTEVEDKDSKIAVTVYAIIKDKLVELESYLPSSCIELSKGIMTCQFHRLQELRLNFGLAYYCTISYVMYLLQNDYQSQIVIPDLSSKSNVASEKELLTSSHINYKVKLIIADCKTMVELAILEQGV